MHLRRGDEFLILLAIRRKSHPSVEEYLQIGPHLFEVLLAGDLHDTRQYAEHPRRNARDTGHVLVETLMSDAVALDLEVGEQGRLFLGNPDEVDQRVYVFDQDS